MTRVVVVADTGAAMAALTAAVGAVRGAYIVRYGNGRTGIRRLVERIEPDLVVIGDLQQPAETLARLDEVRRAAPRAKVVVLVSSAAEGWVAAAPHSDAFATLSSDTGPAALAKALQTVIATPARVAVDASTLHSAERRRRERAGSLRLPTLPQEAAA